MNFVRTTTLFGLVLGLVACSANPTKAPKVDQDPKSYLGARAVERWNLIINKQADKAWDFFSPGYRDLVTRESYASSIGTRPIQWNAAKLVGVECPESGEYCDVTVSIDYETRSGLPGVGMLKASSSLVERWIPVGKDWYFVPKEVARKGRGLQ